MLDKERIIEVFQSNRLNVEIVENKSGHIVVSRMCELYQWQVFTTMEEWTEEVERKMKKAANTAVKPELRKLIARAQSQGQPVKPILTLAGPLPKRKSFTFDLVFVMRREKMTEEALQDTLSLIREIEAFLADVKPEDVKSFDLASL